jgi:hypothetical protein
MKHTFQWLRSNLTGISIPIFGLSWQPPASEKEAIRKLLVYLEDRRSLYASRYAQAHAGRPEHITQSVLDIRKEITATLQSINFKNETKEILEKMRAACRDFLDDSPIIFSSAGQQRTPVSITRMRPWQKAMATSIAALAINYEIDLDENLSSLLSTTLSTS